MLTNTEILHIALQQSAIESCCAPGDFLKNENVVAVSRENAGRRAYLSEPYAFDLTSYGGNAVACVREDLQEVAYSYLAKHSVAHLFETPALHELDAMLAPFGLKTKFQAEYFLPDARYFRICASPYETRVLTPAAFGGLYQTEWGNALCAERKERDMLCVGAYDCGRLVALAGASADCDTMWQIGVDVLPEYRGRGLAKAVTSRLAQEVFARGKVPFYCAAWSNLPSVRNALSCGFRPAWVQLTARPVEKTESPAGAFGFPSPH